MPIENIISGDIFASEIQTLVNPVNCVGVMGKGLALNFKKRFPEMFTDYVQRCQRQEVELGYPYLYLSSTSPHILNFPTKNHWRSKSKLSAIESGLIHLVDNYEQWGITSLAVPALGCGLGQLNWEDVKLLLEQYLESITIPVILFEPA